MLRVGFATACITPPVGMEIPGLFERRVAVGVHDDLFVRACVVDDEHTCAAFVQTDAIKVPRPLVDAGRERAHALCGIAPEHCFIAATHTHSGGPVFAGFMSQADAGYIDWVAAQVASAIAEAHRRRRPTLAGASSGTAAGVAFNRRFIMKDGTQRTHPGKLNPDIVRPAGPEDPTVTVVGFRDPNSIEPFGCVVHFACHATHMNGILYSADYPRWIVETLQRVYGPRFGVVFLNGSCGDVTQADNRSARPWEFGVYWCRRTGQTVGAAALRALALMDYPTTATVDVRSERLRASIRASTTETQQAARDYLATHDLSATDAESIYANELLEVEKIRAKTPEVALEVQGMRVGDAFFWGVPGEFFQEPALRVRDAAKFRHTCCVELANGYYGYICAKDAYAAGGYEPRLARSSILAEDTADRVASLATGLADEMYSRAEAEIASLPKNIAWITEESSALDGINEMDQDVPD